MTGAAAAAFAFAVALPSGATTPGQWTSPSLTITTSRLGAVHTGMTVRQARVAAGVQLTTSGDGQYTSPRAPGLMLELGWGPSSCLAAFAPAHVHTPAGVHLGSTRRGLRAAYESRLQWHTGSVGFSDPRSWYIHNSGGYLFFHLSHIRYGHVIRIADGPGLRYAYC